jgi:hypothetical protein
VQVSEQTRSALSGSLMLRTNIISTSLNGKDYNLTQIKNISYLLQCKVTGKFHPRTGHEGPQGE